VEGGDPPKPSGTAGIVEEECVESLYRIELLIEAGLVQDQALKDLMDESNQLLAITVTSIQTTRNRK
jgi:hypothetical protein